MPTDFDKQSYWSARFAKEKAFEWLLPSTDFINLIRHHLPQQPKSHILHIGSGTSDLHNHFRSLGLVNTLNVDYEPLAVTRGQELERMAFGDVQMLYDVQDATQMTLQPSPEDMFDLVVDKSTADAISCGGDEQLLRMAAGIKRVLKEDGVWISLSYSPCRFQLDGLPFDVDVLDKVLTPKRKETDPDVFHWCYLLRPKKKD